MGFLVFRLYGPMASWGEIAVGEVRHSCTYPSKSAIVGIVAASLGIKRDDEEENCYLAESLKQAVKVLNSGRILKDFHTTQAPDSAGKFRYRTRRDEIVIGKERLGTVLSSREYRTDSHVVVAFKIVTSGKWKLETLRDSLLKPKFNLYLGRKSCPLAAPLDPQIIQAQNFRQALDNYDIKPLMNAHLENSPQWLSDGRWLPNQNILHYYWEGSAEEFSNEENQFSYDQVQELNRYDNPVSRKRWQFQPRKELCWFHNESPTQEVS